MARTAILTSEDKFRAAMNAAGRGPRPASSAAAVPPSIAPLRAGDIHLGEFQTGQLCGLSLKKLVEGRLLIQAASGAGKSWTIRRLLEQTAGLIQQILVDPEGEFRSLAEEVEMVVIDAARLDTAAIAIAAERARQHRLSVLLDLSELDREEQMKMFAAFITPLIEADRKHWHPCLVVIDEAHLFAPFGGQSYESTSVRKQAIAAMVDLMERGRKRGLCGMLATMRIARMSKSVTAPILNFLIGTNTLDLDIRRAADTIGWDARRAFDSLPTLTPGDFIPVGPAFSQNSLLMHVGGVATKHTGSTPELHRHENVEPARAAQLLDLGSLMEAAEQDAAILDEARKPQGYRAVRMFLREKHVVAAVRCWGELVPLDPKGAKVADLAKVIGVAPPIAAEALALLDQFGLVEFSGEGKTRAVRCAKGAVSPP